MTRSLLRKLHPHGAGADGHNGRSAHWAVDKPLNPSLARDIIEGIRPNCAAWSVRGISLVVIAGWRVGERQRHSESRKTHHRLRLTPVPPLENLMLRQRITDQYL